MKKGFTLIELVVAVGILAMMLGFTSVIFNVSIKGARVVNANAEIMQTLRAITNQLDSDLRGLDKDVPLLIWFERGSNAQDDPNRFDQMMFFATGRFWSTQLYDSSGKPVTPADEDKETTNNRVIEGIDARIYYGQAQGSSINKVADKPSKRILCRRRHILTYDEDTEQWPTWGSFSDFDSLRNDSYEHDRLLPFPNQSGWKNVTEDKFIGVVNVVFGNRPGVKMGSPATYHNLLSESVASFKIQWAYWNADDDAKDDELRWFPSDDPDKDNIAAHSHFKINGDNKFGVYFNIADHTEDGFISDNGNWYPIDDGNENKIVYNYKAPSNKFFEDDFYPKALKFTFTIYDSKGVIANGRTFTHIVDLGD